MKLRSTINPEEQANLVDGPTRYPKGPNQHKLVCSFCHRVNYVDDVTFHQAISAMEEGGDNPFCCDDCDAEQMESFH